MANIVRLAKLGGDWKFNELLAYHIVVQEQDQAEFFGGPLPEYAGPVGFIEHENRVQGLDTPSLALMKRLDLAMRLKEGEESAVDDFAAELLRVMGYEGDETVVRTRKSLQLQMCGEVLFAKTDVCLMDASSEILLLVQEDKTHINPSDPEAQLIAEAIAAFQENNAKRVNDRFLEPLEMQVIPGITMDGTFPRFYKIKVTADLDQCVRLGQYPEAQTIVYRHTPRVPRRRSDGMRPLDNRKLVLRCYEAFKKFVYPTHDAQN
ncbi:hypothetical protein BJ165DRAFT_1523902 [Panaeolus papilionaceus]|nr:hypothetical protein BJ165DRAFT_1523902 [Panaeolus papilionaceus]